MSVTNNESTEPTASIQATKLAFILPPQTQRSLLTYETKLALPRVLASHSRATSSGRNVFMNEAAVQVKAVFDLSQGGRSTDTNSPLETFASEQLMVLEAQDGSLVIMGLISCKQNYNACILTSLKSVSH
ncbi:MAG: hypothetical protein RLZZ215_1362 [Pseudomonadota bacterium]|jgi:hypothetical protein